MKILFHNLRFVGPVMVTISVFLFAASYTQREYWLQPRRIAGLLAIHALTLGFVWTNHWHHLVRQGVTLYESGGFVLMEIDWGPWYLVHAIYSYGLLAFTSIFLLSNLRQMLGARMYLSQELAMLLATTTPWSLNVIYVTGVTEIDFTALGFSVTGVALFFAMVRFDILDVIPIGREIAVQEMSDPVVILDRRGRVVDANHAATEFFDVSGEPAGIRGEEFFWLFPDTVKQFRTVTDANTEINVSKDGTEYYLNILVSPIESGGRTVGRVFVFRDITEQKQQERELRKREQRLREREERLDLTRQVLTRVLRHNIRNDLGAIKMQAQLLSDDGIDPDTAADEIVEIADGLITKSEKARDIDKVIKREQTAETLNLNRILRNSIEKAQKDYQDVTFTLECPDEYVVEAIPSLNLVFENLIENAAEHNSDSPEVDVIAWKSRDTILVTVSDNGPGIPDAELEVLHSQEETALKHGSGVGLLLIDWVINNSGASIEYTTSSTGTTVTVSVPQSSHPFMFG